MKRGRPAFTSYAAAPKFLLRELGGLLAHFRRATGIAFLIAFISGFGIDDDETHIRKEASGATIASGYVAYFRLPRTALPIASLTAIFEHEGLY